VPSRSRGQSFGAALRGGASSRMLPSRWWRSASPRALEEMLNSLADFYDEEIETEVGRFITLIEPAILVVMGVVIAVVVLALYMPLFELTSVVSR